MVNMKDYSASEKKKYNLLKDLTLWKSTVVVLDWSFSYSGDVYKLLNSGERKQEFFILSNTGRSVHVDPPVHFRSIIILLKYKYNYENPMKKIETFQKSRQLLEIKECPKSNQYSEHPVSENQMISRIRKQKNNRRWIP